MVSNIPQMPVLRKPLSELWLKQCRLDLETLTQAHGCALQSLDSFAGLEQPRGGSTADATPRYAEEFQNWLLSMKQQLLESPPDFERRSQDAISSGLGTWEKRRKVFQKVALSQDSHVTSVIKHGGNTAKCALDLETALRVMGTSVASLLRSLDLMVDIMDFTDVMGTFSRHSNSADSTHNEGSKEVTADLYMLSPSELRAHRESKLSGRDIIGAVLGGSSLLFAALAGESQAGEKGVLPRSNFIKVRLVPTNETLDSDDLRYSTHITASADHGTSILDYELPEMSASSHEEIKSNVFRAKQVRGLDQRIVAALCKKFDSWVGDLDAANDLTQDKSEEKIILYEAKALLEELSYAYSESLTGGGASIG
jgi:hypothetical protein